MTTSKRALVTGAGARLGKAMALALGADGWDVAVHYNSSAGPAEKVAEDIRANGQNAVALGADLLDEDALQGLVPRAMQALGGPITLLVNNASIFEEDDLATATRESWDRHIGSNLRAPFVLTQAVGNHAPEPELEGRWNEPLASALVVNMIDQRVRALNPQFMTYTIAKMGLWAFTRTAAQALAPKVRVNGIGPGPTLQGARQAESDFAEQRSTTILNRGSDPEGIIRALFFLIEAREVTGQLLCIDGGQHLTWQTPDVMGVE